MQQNKFLKAFIEDCRYYDLENKELKNILKYVEVKGKTILDVGAGIGRLSFPLVRYAKAIVALDKDKRLGKYWKKHKNKKIKFVNESLEKFVKKNQERKFEIILIAWPTFDLRNIKTIKKFCYNKTKIIFISCYNNSDFETIADKLRYKISKKAILKKEGFIKELTNNFKIIKKKQINTEYVYPNEKIALKVISNSLKMWYNMKLKAKDEKLKEVIEKHKKDKKIIFKEKLYFYVLKCK